MCKLIDKSVNEPKNSFILKDDIIKVSLSALNMMYDTENKLFYNRAFLEVNHLAFDGLSLRYSLISLLGLIKAEQNGFSSELDTEEIIKNIYEKSSEIKSVGDLGLILWATTLIDKDLLKSIIRSNILLRTFEIYNDWKQKYTTEIAWFLMGLCYAAECVPEHYENLLEIIKITYNALKGNYVLRTGLFRHLSYNSLAGIARGNIGCFADQVYPIVALSKYYKVFSEKEALNSAIRCAEKIYSLQGDKGQWWWHYDVGSGVVIGKYPVFSVHQDGMAPMALFAVADVSNHDFEHCIYKGLKWIMGENEKSFNFIDNSRKVIWRSLYRRKYRAYYDMALNLMGFHNKESNQNDLMIKYECRPYHLGWILYAFADKA